MAYKENHVIIINIIRKYLIALGILAAIFYGIYYLSNMNVHYVYQDRLTNIEEIARFKDNGDSMILYKINYNKTTYFSIIKK